MRFKPLTQVKPAQAAILNVANILTIRSTHMQKLAGVGHLTNLARCTAGLMMLLALAGGATAQTMPDTTPQTTSNLAGRYTERPGQDPANAMTIKAVPTGYVWLIDNQEVPLLPVGKTVLNTLSQTLFKTLPEQSQLACYSMDSAFLCSAQRGLVLPGAQQPLASGVFLLTEPVPGNLQAQELYTLP
jgi:hypothetical protein